MVTILQTMFSNAFSWMKTWISNNISSKCVPRGPIDNKSPTIHIKAWRRISANLNQGWSSLLMHICVTQPQWVNDFNPLYKGFFSDTSIYIYMHFLSFLDTERVNSNPHGQNGCDFADDIFKGIYVNGKFCISNQIFLKVVLKGSVNNKSTLVKAMAWRRIGDTLLPEIMLTQFTDAYMWL